MKTKHIDQRAGKSSRRLFAKPFVTLAVAAVVGLSGLTARADDAALVAHEWGTFTSLQGGDGALMSWKPLQTSQLPGFVYDWKKAGLGRIAAGELAWGKGMMTTLQRMETPVIYFYADKEQSVDVAVRFPQGTITEWYPQAGEIGPSLVADPTSRKEAPQYKPGVKDSLIHWSGIKVTPASQGGGDAKLPMDTSGSHYFAARETDAASLTAGWLVKSKHGPEHEKFLFYRGVGNFATPLHVTMKADDSIVAQNTGKDALRHLFVLKVHNQKAQFIYIDALQAGEEKTVSVASQTAELPLATTAEQLGAKMAESLTAEGLYSREALAMVNTWKDSWFTENGVRVLYVLPRAWTDGILPIQITPAPKELVRVMVGRAEVLTPEFEEHLAQSVAKATKGDAEAMAQVRESVQQLGRFAEPALFRAVTKANTSMESSADIMALLRPAQPQAASAVASKLQ